MNSPRINLNNHIHFITNRCEHEMFLLLPTKSTNELIKFWMAKAICKYASDIEIYAFCFLSNHFHILLRDPQGQLAVFMNYFQGNLARSINKKLNRRGKFWSREYNDVIVDGEDEFWNRYSYTVLNPVSTGLVSKGEQWPGLSSMSYVLSEKNEAIVGKGINETKRGNAARYKKKDDAKDYKETFQFNLSVPPPLMTESPIITEEPAEEIQQFSKEQVSFIDKLLEGATNEYNKRQDNTTPMGTKNIMKQNPFSSPVKSKRTPQFKFMSFCQNRKRELRDQYKAFVASYKDCIQVFRNRFDNIKKFDADKGNIPWPEGCYLPASSKTVIAY